MRQWKDNIRANLTEIKRFIRREVSIVDSQGKEYGATECFCVDGGGKNIRTSSEFRSLPNRYN